MVTNGDLQFIFLTPQKKSNWPEQLYKRGDNKEASDLRCYTVVICPRLGYCCCCS